jgi:aprataxin
MARLAAWLAVQLREQEPGLAPLRAGFHAVPSMRQLHLHLISQDFDSACLKNKKHFNSFATDFFVPPETWVRQLQQTGRVSVDKAAEEAKLKRDMVCPATGRPLSNMPALKAHLASAEYQRAMRSGANS